MRSINIIQKYSHNYLQDARNSIRINLLEIKKFFNFRSGLKGIVKTLS